MAHGAVDISLPLVDVRDVSQAHVAAGYSATASGRNIILGHSSSIFPAANTLLPKYADYPVLTRILPNSLDWLVGPLVALERSYIWNNVGITMNIDNSKSKRAFGIKYYSLEETMRDMMKQMIEEGELL
jgi:nucleoside-diphosphate-sugar epimerase